MGYGKQFEDDCAIAEERATLGKQEERPIFSFTITETIYAPLAPTPQPTQKKEKHKPKKLVCRDCGTSFFFKGGEQRYFEKHDLQEPKRCRACRKARKNKIKTQKENRI